MPLAGRTAVISGAASGMGRAIAQRCSGMGCPVVIADIDAGGLAETEATLSGPVLSRVLDVRDRGAWMELAAATVEWSDAPIGLVMNNAGVALAATVSEGSTEDHEWVMDINFNGVVNGTYAFLPILLEQDSGAIVNTSSVFGLMGVPTQSAYCAAKFAVRGFTESLRHELDGTGVRAATVHPGGVKTNIARNGRVSSDPIGLERTREEIDDSFDVLARMEPERAAEIILKGVDAGKSRILVGGDAVFIDTVMRVAPTRYATLLKWFQRAITRAAARRA